MLEGFYKEILRNGYVIDKYNNGDMLEGEYKEDLNNDQRNTYIK